MFRIIFIAVLQFLIAFLVLSSGDIFAKSSEKENANFFEIEKSGISFTLAPSAHQIVDLPFPKKYAVEIIQRIELSRGICLESDVKRGEYDFVQNPSVQKLLIDVDHSVSRYILEQSTRDILLDQLNIDSEMKSRYLKFFTPFKFQAEIIKESIPFERTANRSALDLFFETVARNWGKPVHFLETSEEGAQQVITTFKNLEGWANSLKILSQFVQCEYCKKEYIFHGKEFLRQVFFVGNLEMARYHFDKYMTLSGENYPLGEAIWERRSEYLVEKILLKISSKECDVFLIGGSHFLGEKAVQKILEKKGYTVTPKFSN